jgi:hypothetical protein
MYVACATSGHPQCPRWRALLDLCAAHWVTLVVYVVVLWPWRPQERKFTEAQLREAANAVNVFNLGSSKQGLAATQAVGACRCPGPPASLRSLRGV